MVLKSLLLLCGCIGFTGICYAQVVSSTELISKAKEYDGKTVVYQGEVIGEVMARGEYAWINLNDSKNAIGVWIKKDLTKDIALTGSYRTFGDLAEIEGVFHRSCIEHGGDLDIHATSLRLVKKGNEIVEKISPRRLKTAWVFGAMVVLLWISRILANPRRKK